MTAHPIDIAIVDGAQVIKSDVRGLAKLHYQFVAADIDEVRNTNLSGQYGGVYVRELDAAFKLDNSDATIADDGGISALHDLVGNIFLRIAVDVSVVARVVDATGDVTIDDDEAASLIWINNISGGAINVYWPSSARGGAFEVKDYGLNAGTYNITLLPKAGSSPAEALMGASSYVLDVDGMGLKLSARPDGLGWG